MKFFFCSSVRARGRWNQLKFKSRLERVLIDYRDEGKILNPVNQDLSPPVGFLSFPPGRPPQRHSRVSSSSVSPLIWRGTGKRRTICGQRRRRSCPKVVVLTNFQGLGSDFREGRSGFAGKVSTEAEEKTTFMKVLR